MRAPCVVQVKRSEDLIASVRARMEAHIERSREELHKTVARFKMTVETFQTMGDVKKLTDHLSKIQTLKDVSALLLSL